MIVAKEETGNPLVAGVTVDPSDGRVVIIEFLHRVNLYIGPSLGGSTDYLEKFQPGDTIVAIQHFYKSLTKTVFWFEICKHIRDGADIIDQINDLRFISGWDAFERSTVVISDGSGTVMYDGRNRGEYRGVDFGRNYTRG